MINSSVDCIVEKIRELKKDCNIITNCFINYKKLKELLFDNCLTGYIYGENVYIIERQNGFKYLYFYCKNINGLANLNQFLEEYDICGTIVINVLINHGKIDEYKSILKNVGFEYYKKYIRNYFIYNDKCKFPDSIEVNFAQETECKEICKIINENFDKLSDCIVTLEELECLIKNRCVLSINLNSNIAGFLIFEDKNRSSYVRCLYISEKYRNKKFANKLFDKYFSIHDDTIKFTLWVDSLNYKAKNLYKKRGYLEDKLENHVFICNL